MFTDTQNVVSSANIQLFGNVSFQILSTVGACVCDLIQSLIPGLVSKTAVLSLHGSYFQSFTTSPKLLLSACNNSPILQKRSSVRLYFSVVFNSVSCKRLNSHLHAITEPSWGPLQYDNTVLEETLVNFDQIIKWNQAHKLIFTNFKVLPVSFIHGKSTGTNIKANLKVF